MPHNRELSYILVGDHLGYLKIIKIAGYGEDDENDKNSGKNNKKYEMFTFSDVEEHHNDNPIISIEPLPNENCKYYDTIYDDAKKYLIACKMGHIYIYDSTDGSYRIQACCYRANLQLCKAVPIDSTRALIVYDKMIDLLQLNGENSKREHYCPKLSNVKLMLNYNKHENVNRGSISYLDLVKTKTISLKCARENSGKFAICGENVALRVYDLETKKRIFTGSAPEPDWLGIRAGIYVTGVDFLGGCENSSCEPHKLITCSMSDSVVRLYDTRSNSNNSSQQKSSNDNGKPSTKPVLTIDLNDRSFNEYAEAPKFTTIAASRCSYMGNNQCILLGSNVGQVIAIDLRFSPTSNNGKSGRNGGRHHRASSGGAKHRKSKQFKHLGEFKGSLGSCIKDIEIVAQGDGSNKVVTCSLDRHVRIHNFTRSSLAFTSRALESKIFVKTKPQCCVAIYRDMVKHDESDADS